MGGRRAFGWGALAIAALVVVVVLAGGYQGMEYYTSQSSFCGTVCHIMDEPYRGWKNSKHYAPDGDEDKQAGCVDCHFLPGEHASFKAKMEGLRHLAAYLYDPDAHMPIRPVVKDGACLQSGCHAASEFQDKTIQFSETSTFKHGDHLEKETLEGQKLFCDTCHVKHSEDKHFEVPKEICFTCHFWPEAQPGDGKRRDERMAGHPGVIEASFDQGTTARLNTGASKCSLCHTIPTKSLQSQLSADDPSKKPITHQTLEEAGVSCESCHLHQVVSTVEIKTDECLDCHSASPDLFSKGRDAKLMHDAHVAGRRADCLECHRPSEHGSGRDYLDSVRSGCTQCHSDPHRLQKILLAGLRVSENIEPVPGLMHSVETNCAGCHDKVAHGKGDWVKTGSGETCVECHTPEHDEMLNDWKNSVEGEVAFVEEVETEAVAALAAAEGRLDPARLDDARNQITASQQLLNVVRFGGGVHNKKYSIMILDQALTGFEDTIDLLGSSE